MLFQADCLLRLAQSAAWKQDYDTARNQARRALQTYAERHFLRGQARCKWILGFVEMDSYGDYTEAERLLLGASKLYHILDDPTGEANALRILGRLAIKQYAFDAVDDYLTQGYDMYAKVKWRYGQADCLQAKGELRLAAMELEAAEGHFRAALAIYEELNHKGGRIFCQRSLGDVALARGDLTNAASQFEVARTLSTSPADQARIEGCLGCLALRQKEHEQAKILYKSALNRVQGERNMKFEEAQYRQGLSDALCALGQDEAALTHLATAQGLNHDVNNKRGRGDCARKMGMILLRYKNYQGAQDALRAAIEQYNQAHYVDGARACAEQLNALTERKD
jgi:tetratricopeptide (TPR) repeat protein